MLDTSQAKPASLHIPAQVWSALSVTYLGCVSVQSLSPLKVEIRPPDCNCVTWVLIDVCVSIGEKPQPLKLSKKRNYGNAFHNHSMSSQQENDSSVPSIDPKEDHNYSASSMASQRCASLSSVSSLSSIDEVYEFVSEASRVGSDGSDGFHSEVDTDGEDEDEDDPLADSGYTAPPRIGTTDRTQPHKKALEDLCQEIDEELKEAAGSLLHLAGISTCLGSLISTAKTHNQKQRKKK